jgi:hypothetical protein
MITWLSMRGFVLLEARAITSLVAIALAYVIL